MKPQEKALSVPVLDDGGYLGPIGRGKYDSFKSGSVPNLNPKALMHDLDTRFETQDRMINYLI